MRFCAALFFTCAFAFAASPAILLVRRQHIQGSEASRDEIVVNLAAGRVVIAVLKDAILVGTIENPIEAGARLPVPVKISDSHLGVVLGAVEWIDPASRTRLARLDLELPHLRGQGPTGGPHLGSPAGAEAGDLEAVGDGLLERLNQLARDLHAKIETPDGLPLARLVLAGFVPQYGPEVWQLDYSVRQSEQAVGYWTTHVLRPSYTQVWPPEKGQPHTLLEFSYPREPSAPPLLTLLGQSGSRLQGMARSDPRMAEAEHAILAGETNKLKSADAIQFFRAAIDQISPPATRQAVASLGEESGFAWLVAPPAEPALAAPDAGRPAGAPSLRHPSQ